MNRAQSLEWERRWALPAALAAFAAAILFIASTPISAANLLGSPDNEVELLREFYENSSDLLLSGALRAVAFLAFTLPLYFLFRAASTRSQSVRRGLVGVVIAGPIFVAALDLIFWFAIDPAAKDFATPGGGTGVAIGFTFAVVYTSLWAMRVGLLTRFIGTLGMALGVAQLLIPFTVAGLMLWMAWLGLIFINRVPGGRPPAWKTGEAIPWPKPGEAPAEPSEPASDTVEGEATELGAEAENPNAPRRERAKRRKRKRRR
jgi:MFS family permease